MKTLLCCHLLCGLIRGADRDGRNIFFFSIKFGFWVFSLFTEWSVVLECHTPITNSFRWFSPQCCWSYLHLCILGVGTSRQQRQSHIDREQISARRSKPSSRWKWASVDAMTSLPAWEKSRETLRYSRSAYCTCALGIWFRGLGWGSVSDFLLQGP